jgi:hypothetical protein
MGVLLVQALATPDKYDIAMAAIKWILGDMGRILITRTMQVANRNPLLVATGMIGALALACAGCGSSCGSSSTSGNERDQPDEIATMPLQSRSITPTYTEHIKPPPLPQQDEIELIDAGKAPRRMFRYRPDDKARELVITARITSRELGQGSVGPRVAVPEIRYGLGLGATAAPASADDRKDAKDAKGTKGAKGAKDDDSGTGNAAMIRVDLRGLVATVAEPAQDEADPTAPTAAADDFLAHYRGHVERRRATAMLSDRGFIGPVTLMPDAATSAQASDIRHAIEQLIIESVVPVPQQAVGKGARWRVTTRLRRGPSVVTQKAEYVLLDAKKDRLRVKATVTQIGERQIMSMPGLPPSMLAELIALFWRAEGELEVVASSLTPVAGTLSVEMRVHGRTMKIDANNLDQPGGGQDHFIENLGTVVLSTTATTAPAAPAPSTAKP